MKDVILYILIFLGICLGISFLSAWIAVLIWNKVLIALFTSLPLMKWWQMWLILLFIDIVFGGFKSKSSSNKD